MGVGWKTIIPVSEVFHSIQGEGEFMGRNAVFVRVAGCNLVGTCGKYCDTDFRYKFFMTHDDFMRLIHDVYKNGGIMVITGGEPLLYREFFRYLLRRVYKKFGREMIEKLQFETNGTLKPLATIYGHSVKYAVSPKRGAKLNDWWYDVVWDGNAILKYVVGNVPADSMFWGFEDIKKEIESLKVVIKDRVYLMPYGATLEELERNAKDVFELAKTLGVNYSDRLHIRIYGKEVRGV